MNWFGTIDWGTAPDWLAAVGTAGTLAAAVWQQWKEGKRLTKLEEIEAERMAQEAERQRRLMAQKVMVHLDPAQLVTEYSNGGIQKSRIHKVTVTNGGDAPIHGLTLHEYCGPQLKYYGSLPPNESWTPGVHAERVGQDENVEISFFDVDGREWLLDTLGNLYDEDSPEFQERWESQASTGPVISQPTPPVPDPSAPAEDGPDPGTAS